MTPDQEHFEQELRRDLSRLSQTIDSGLAAGQVTAKVRRRVWRRRGVAAAAFFLAAAGVLTWILVGQNQSERMAPTASTEPGRGVLPEPLRVDASPGEIVERLRQYLASIGAVGSAEVEKDSDGQVSFALSGKPDRSTQAIRSGFEAVFRNFSQAHVRASAGNIRFRLVARGRSTAPVQPPYLERSMQ